MAGTNILLEDNARLNQTLSEYHRPLETRTTFKVGDYGQLPHLLYMSNLIADDVLQS